MKDKIWLIGAGPMAVDYAKVLDALSVKYEVIGRSEQSAINFEEVTNHQVHKGGLEKWLSKSPTKIPDTAIVAVGVENLAGITISLLNGGFKNILLEKPGGLSLGQIQKVVELSKKEKANVLVAYNRRFYASVIRAKEMVESDGGVKSFNFEFTEWAHTIEPLIKAQGVKEAWLLANSTHVIDLSFYLGGIPSEFTAYVAGGLSWHPSGSIYSGAGRCQNGALFSYQANWESAGRWSLEILTSKRRLILKPLERLQVQEKGSVQVNDVDGIDYSYDEKFKPGLFLQVERFLENDFKSMISIISQEKAASIYAKIGRIKN